MINSNSLPPDHCYLEYPGGVIKLALYESGAKNFTIVHELETEESSNLRRKFNLELIRQRLPELHIITGSNGAGKSSVGAEYLPSHINKVCTVFDGDKLTLEKTKELFATKLHSYKEAKNLANEWIEVHFNTQVEEAINKANHFAYEGHFREAAAWKVIDRFRRKGYSVHMIFLA